jgi:F0F1-type ATP synthase assembly protein I
MIEKLYEERQLALTSTFDLEKRVESLESQVNDYKLANQRLELELREASRKSFVMFALSLLATVMVGIGVNIATASPIGWAGWIMIISACLLEGIAYFLRPQKGN